MAPVITKDLQDTLHDHPNIEEVHFDARGRHYFNVHKLISGEKDKKENYLTNTDTYGRGLFSHRQIIPGEFNVDKKKEDVAKGDPDTLIVETLTRDEILDTEVKEEGQDIVAQVSNATDAQKQAILGMLGFDSNMVEALKKLVNDTPAVQTPPAVIIPKKPE